MTDETKCQAAVLSKVTSTLLDLMDNEDPAVRLDAVRLALGTAVLTGRKDKGPSGRGQPKGSGRRGGEE